MLLLQDALPICADAWIKTTLIIQMPRVRVSPPARRRGSKRRLPLPVSAVSTSPPARRRGSKHVAARQIFGERQSPPARRRGSKRRGGQDCSNEGRVASCAEEWVENPLPHRARHV